MPHAAAKSVGEVFLWSKIAGCLFLLCTLSLAAKQSPKPTNDECLVCHGDAGLSTEREGKSVSLAVDPEKFKTSMHGSILSCVDCHQDVATSPHDKTPAKVSCATCHADQQAAYDRSFHAKAIKAGDGKAATCTDCHGSPHELLAAADTKSKVNHANLAATCGTCHGQKFVMEASGHSAQPYLSYQESVHGRAVAAGSEKAAVCTDCHGSHEILQASDPKSPIFKFNVPQTCAKCHNSIQQEFQASIHGQAINRGNWQAPVCTDCHGIHSIKSHIDPNSSVAAANLAKATCARCHEGVRLSDEFGIEGRRSTTYLASYHGLASKLGSQVVANCASCHGVHNILPSSDSRATTNRANLVRTCGQCHPGVTEKFALGKVHVDAPLSADTGSVAVRLIRKFYLGMIFAVIGAMLVHNFIIWRRKAAAHRDAHHRSVTRMNKQQRWQHVILFTSFFVLVFTGFALKFPDSWFATLLGMSERFRGWTHRFAGVVLIGVGVYHIAYIALTRDGRRLVADFLPIPRDAADVWSTMRYYLGLSSDRPTYGRFTYAEKAEYWALVWGLIVMAATGIMLWAKVSVGNLLPRWWLDVATAVHFYEAVLATLAIVVWHFYQVFFDPETYPMNWAWWDGKMSFEHYSEEHGLDSNTLLASLELEHEETAQSETGEEVSSIAGGDPRAQSAREKQE
ncbi:MAG TPA: cytochrome b/b6 domain-containing protein [Terriglobales bacterium]|jgi:cytochrome b subunit of formate dehydrogenase|nr:cytochrome b/b6 domain-containing protein [Terriglobales bacterium]